MPSYPYKVRVLAAIDSLFTPRDPTRPISLQYIGMRREVAAPLAGLLF